MKQVFFAICLLSALLVSGIASAQLPPFPPAIRTIPATPTSGTPVTIEVDIQVCFTLGVSASFTSPYAIRLDLAPGGLCPVLPPVYVPVRVPVGALAPGTYLVNVYYGSRLLSTALFTVGTAPAIPTLSAFGLAVLALALGAAGVAHSRKRRSK